ncbi:MAG: hypothetical protein WAU81_03305 [Candidatus Aminicenantales bacterium]
MRIFRPLAVAAVLVLAVGSCPAQTRNRPPAKPSPPEERNSLLRMDLLQLRQGGMAPAQRNIFAPQARTSRPMGILPQGDQQAAPDDQAADMSVLSAREAAVPPVMSVDLRYIGFIESSRLMIALVVFEGRAVAVVEGEVVSEGIRIGKITREQVEVILPDSSARAFPLEGE